MTTTSTILLIFIVAVFFNLAETQSLHLRDYPAINTAKAGGESRVVHGNDAAPGQFPYMVALAVGSALVCGSALISQSIILTAGHVIVISGIPVEVHLGAHNIYDLSEEGRVIVTTRDTHVHENFNPLTMTNDVAFVRLNEPVTLSPTIALIRLPRRSQAEETFENSIAIITGWGITNSSHSDISPVLRYGETTVISNTNCSLSYEEGTIKDTMLCSVELTGAPCSSDSGGPLATTESDGVATLIGTVSFGRGISCENGDPGVYSRVSLFLDWIENNTGVIIEP